METQQLFNFTVIVVLVVASLVTLKFLYPVGRYQAIAIDKPFDPFIVLDTVTGKASFCVREGDLGEIRCGGLYSTTTRHFEWLGK